MKKKDPLKDEILDLIENSNMKIGNKLSLMKLLDKAFRQHMGVMFVTDEEIEQNDILSRSM